MYAKKGTVASELEEEVLRKIHRAGLPWPEINTARFIKARPRMKGDWVWPTYKILLEVDGGERGIGRPCPVCKRRRTGGHTSAEGMQRDRIKDNLAQLEGYIVIRVTKTMVDTGLAMKHLIAAFNLRGWEDR